MYITWENKFPIISRNFFPNKKNIKKSNIFSELQVLMLMTVYMDLQECNQLWEKRISLVYAQCATLVFNYLYRAGQLKADKVGFDSEIRKHIEDVIITLATD